MGLNGPVQTMQTPSPPFVERLYGIQGLRGVAVLLVFSVHLYEVERRFTHGPRLLDAWIHGANSGLDLFLVVSGFVLLYLAFGHFQSAEYRRSYVFARFTRVYPVYLLYTLPLVPVYLMAPHLFNASAGHEVDLLRSLLLLPDEQLPLIPVAWTLHHEIYLYLVLLGFLFLREAWVPRAIAVWFVITLLLAVWCWHVPREQQGAFEKVLVNPINFNFVFGMAVAWLVRQGAHRYAWASLIGGIAWLVVGYTAYYAVTGRDWLDVFSEVFIFAMPAALITYGVVALERQHRVVFARPLIWIGDAAYSIYLTHTMSIVLAGRIWREIGVGGWPAHLLFMACTIAFGLAVGKLCYEFIEKPLLKALRRYDPARRARPQAAGA